MDAAELFAPSDVSIPPGDPLWQTATEFACSEPLEELQI